MNTKVSQASQHDLLLINNSQQKCKINVVYKECCNTALWGAKEILIPNNRYLFMPDKIWDALKSSLHDESLQTHLQLSRAGSNSEQNILQAEKHR